MSARSPLFTARIDRPRSTVSARGHLDAVGVDLLRGTLETLRRDGHPSITLDLAQLTGPASEDVLSGIVAELSAAGATIVVRRKPSWHPRPEVRQA